MATTSRPAPDEQTRTEAGPAPSEAPSETQETASPLGAIEAQLSELIAYAAHYLSAQRDLTDWRFRRILLGGASLAGFGLALVAGLVTAAVFVLRGAAHGLGAAFGGRIWAGELITGLTVFLALAVAQRVLYRQMRRSWQERSAVKYEQLRQRQRAAFGHDAEQMADEHGSR